MRKAILSVIAAFMLTALCYAQTSGKDRKSNTPYNNVAPAFTVIATSASPITTFGDSVTEDGHYRFVVDDSSNKWRCQITSQYGVDHSASPAAGAAVTIVCVYAHAPSKGEK